MHAVRDAILRNRRSTPTSRLPSTAQGFIKLNDAQELFKTQAREIELSLKQIAISIERVELGVDAAVVAEVREPETDFQSFLKLFLFDAAFVEALMSDQRVGSFGERRLNRLLVLNQHALVLSLGELDAGLKPPRGEYRLGDLRCKVPEAGRSTEQAG